MRGHTRRRARLDALVLLLGLLLGLAHVADSQCPNNAQLPGGATQWTSCACNAGYTNTSGLINLARACSAGGCPVTTSSQYAPDTPGSNVVDGITTNAFLALLETNPWLIIDFEQPVFVSSVRIFNRWDCCQDRLNNFEIRVGYAGTSSTFSSNPACAENQPTFTGDKNFSCILNGRYLSLRQINTNYMQIAELEVYGRKTSNLARACSAGGCPVTGSSDYGNTFRYLVDGDTSETALLLHSSSSSNEWMLIDLQQTAFVNSVSVFNRKDACCVQRINNFEIRVGHSSTFSNNPACVTGEAWFPDVKTFSCVLSGRYVSIQQFNTEWMNLRELEVYGLKASEVCTACLPGTFKSATGSGACTDCGAGMYSGALGATAASTCTGCSVKYHASSFITDTFAKYPPHLVASAVGWDARKAEFQDWSGNAREGKLTAGAASVGGIKDNGAGSGVFVPLVGGGTTAKIHWGSLSVPATFTVCSISRYSGATKGRILTGRRTETNMDWIHGHHAGNAGATFYDKDMNVAYTITPNTKWVVACGRNVVGVGRSNTIINNVVTSSDKGGTGSFTLRINPGTGELSDWQLSSVYVWNSHLPDDVFAQVSADLNAQLAGTVANACSECPAGRFSVDSTRLNCVSCPAGKYKDIAGAQWSFRTDESPYGWQEAYDEAAAAGRRLPTVAEMRAYINRNPSAFTQFDGVNRWTPVVNPGVSNSRDWLQIGTGDPYYQEPRGITHYERYNDLVESGNGETGTHDWRLVYTEVFDACTDCPAGKISAAIGASSSGACASCAAGKYQDAVVVVTNPPEASRTYSSAFSCSGSCAVHDKSMLDGTFCWSPINAHTLAGQWMQIDLGSSFRVHGVVTQCRFDASQCVLEMEVQYSLTTSGFVSATALDGTTRFFMPTAWSSTAKTMSNFSQSVTARYIRIYPQRWYDAMSMRAGVLTSLASAAWNACADCGAGKYSAATGATAASACQCNAGTRVYV